MGSSATLVAFTALALLILVLPSPTNADVIGDAIKDSITTGISNMFVGAFNLAVTTVKNTAAWIFQKIVGYFKNLTSNMIASMARAWPMALCSSHLTWQGPTDINLLFALRGNHSLS